MCGRLGFTLATTSNLRETFRCSRCNSFNRQRQLAFVVIRGVKSPNVQSFAELARRTELAIYNTEARGPVHEALRINPRYRGSEFFGPEVRSGEIVDGIEHQDLQALSFADNAFDLVLSSDVFEHVPLPYRGHQEVFRVLKPGGRHVFTVPFIPENTDDDVRAVPKPDGSPELLKEAIYHLDPQSPDGTLVWNIFGMGLLDRLREIGFEAKLHKLHRPSNAIYGPNAYVFEATKPAAG